MLGVDVRGSSERIRDDSLLPALRTAQTSLIAAALRQQGVDQDAYALRSRGDGGRYDFLPGVSPVPVVEALTGPLPSLLRRHNKQSSEALKLGLRLVAHGGYLVPAPDGGDADGAEVNLLHGMLDAEELRSALVDSGAPYVLAVSEEIWNGVVRHGHGDLDPDAFEPARLTVKGGATVTAWLSPEFRGHPHDDGASALATAAPRPRDTTGTGSPGQAEQPGRGGITFQGRVKAKNVVSGDQWNIR
ncbi:hypothetical protein AB0G20_35400 [Streptomyces sp. NPDC024017]|uniref:hypothetical protein n=1 Tax=Streptomyces sp. NPDC024017 TaxID=3154326 RepID=UPI0033C02868